MLSCWIESIESHGALPTVGWNRLILCCPNNNKLSENIPSRTRPVSSKPLTVFCSHFSYSTGNKSMVRYITPIEWFHYSFLHNDYYFYCSFSVFASLTLLLSDNKSNVDAVFIGKFDFSILVWFFIWGCCYWIKYFI